MEEEDDSPVSLLDTPESASSPKLRSGDRGTCFTGMSSDPEDFDAGKYSSGSSQGVGCECNGLRDRTDEVRLASPSIVVSPVEKSIGAGRLARPLEPLGTCSRGNE
jgi:hypothetical protein